MVDTPKKPAVDASLLVHWLDLASDEVNTVVCKRLSEYCKCAAVRTKIGAPRRRYLGDLVTYIDGLATRHEKVGIPPAGADEVLWQLLSDYLIAAPDETGAQWLTSLRKKSKHPAMRDMLDRVGKRLKIERKRNLTRFLEGYSPEGA